MKTYFNTEQLFFLISGGSLVFISLWLFVIHKQKGAFYTLLLGGLSLFVFAALLDPFLNLWDERFHALVAKNMMSDPLKPMLYTEKLIELDYSHWAKAHIWLHKQPLFLWQIALSFKVFGVSEFALRLPSVLMSCAMIAVGYRSGTLLVNKQVGYLTGLLFATSFYLIELVSGRQMLDQNDVIFMGYISLSIWSWLEYRHSGNKYWIVLIGLFSGAAVLTKWFIGLIVFLGWGMTSLYENKWSIKKYGDFGVALLICAMVIVPWQVYTFTTFPLEAMEEWKYNTLHFWVEVEWHGGGSWYHLNQLGSIFGMLVPLIILPGMYLLIKRAEDKLSIWGMLAMIIGVQLFFLLAATKMPSFTFVLALPIFLGTAVFLNWLIELIQSKISWKILGAGIVFVGLVVVCLTRLDIEKLQAIHTDWREENSYTDMLIHNREVFIELNKRLPKNAVLFNVRGRHYIEAMFYTGLPAYNFVPDNNQINQLKGKGYEIYIFNSLDLPIPTDYKNDSRVQLIEDVSIEGYE